MRPLAVRPEREVVAGLRGLEAGHDRAVVVGAVRARSSRRRRGSAGRAPEAVSGSGSSGEPSSFLTTVAVTGAGPALVAHGLLQGVLGESADEGADQGRGDEDQQEGRERHPGLDEIGRPAQRIVPPAPESADRPHRPHPLPASVITRGGAVHARCPAKRERNHPRRPASHELLTQTQRPDRAGVPAAAGPRRSRPRIHRAPIRGPSPGRRRGSCRGISGTRFCPKTSLSPKRRCRPRVRSGSLPRSAVSWSVVVTTQRPHVLATRKVTSPIARRDQSSSAQAAGARRRPRSAGSGSSAAGPRRGGRPARSAS